MAVAAAIPRVRTETLLGIEIGGTKLQLLVGDSQGQILDRIRLHAESQGGASAIQLQIAEGIRRLRQKYSFDAVGVGFGGPVNWRTGAIAVSHQVEGWSGFPLVEWISNMAGAPCVVDNDANVAALGEATCGAGGGFDKVFYVTLGSGVGGGLVSAGAIYHGAHPGECEVGHLRLDSSGTTVVSRCSGWALDARIRNLPESERQGELWRLAQGMQRGEARQIAPALQAADPAASRLLEETCADLAFALSHVTHLLHPDVIVLGGGLAEIGEPLRRGAAERLRGLIMEVFQPGPVIALAALREDAVPIGALQLAKSLNPQQTKVI